MADHAANRETLPTNVRPIHYDLILSAFSPDETSFEGQSTILVDVKEATDSVVMNALELDVRSAGAYQAGRAIPAEPSYDPATERVTLSLREPLAPGRAKIVLNFRGTLNDQMCGFYRSEYMLPNGTRRTMATTQFEACHARRAFPCWDEPSAKATFAVAIEAPADRTIISNGEVASVKEMGARKLVRFAKTPPMSTYLLAFIVGDLECVEATAACGTKVRVWATPGKREQCRFALDFAVKALDWFTGYFGIRYAMPKADLIAVPDFAAGAMENWGAITFAEKYLLVDANASSQQTRQYAAEVIAHELAHQWFGNMVTMRWWNDLWLNEAFATWIGNKCTDAICPEWELWTQFVAHEVTSALELDGLKSSHPIDVPVARAQDVDEIFDTISYNKGGSVLRMLEARLGEGTFRDGLRLYMSRHAFGNTEAKDLWLALEGSSGFAVSAMMRGWTDQVGYPLVTCALHDGEDGGLYAALSQNRFLTDGIDASDRTLWTVPLRLRSGTAEADAVLAERTGDASIEARAGWLCANADRTAVCRVNYCDRGWAALTAPLGACRLSTEERLALLDDAKALAAEGAQPIGLFLDLAASCRNEPSYVVWKTICGGLSDIANRMGGDLGPVRDRFDRFVRELVEPRARALGWAPRDDERHSDALLRPLLISTAGRHGHGPTVFEAVDRFDAAVRGAEIHPDLRTAVYATTAACGDRRRHEGFRALHERSALQEERGRLLWGLAGFRDRSLLDETLAYAMSDRVRSRDALDVLCGVAANPSGSELAWTFVRERWDEMVRRYAANVMLLGRLVEAALSNLSRRDAIGEARSFFAEHPVEGLDRTIAQALERVALNVRWVERNGDDVLAWFSEN